MPYTDRRWKDLRCSLYPSEWFSKAKWIPDCPESSESEVLFQIPAQVEESIVFAHTDDRAAQDCRMWQDADSPLEHIEYMSGVLHAAIPTMDKSSGLGYPERLTTSPEDYLV